MWAVEHAEERTRSSLAMATGPPPSWPPASPNDVGLDESDLKDLCEELHKVNVKYYSIGLQISVEPDKIDCIEADYKHANERLREVLKVRLKRTPALTWVDIVSALRSQMVDEPWLADSIEQGHCRSDPCISDQQPEPVMHRKGKSAATKRKFASHLHGCSDVGDTKRSKMHSEIPEFHRTEMERIEKRKSRKPSKVSIPILQKEQDEKKKEMPRNEAAVLKQDTPSPKSVQGDSESDSDGSSEDKEDRDSEQISSNEEDETDTFSSAATSQQERKTIAYAKAKSLQKNWDTLGKRQTTQIAWNVKQKRVKIAAGVEVLQGEDQPGPSGKYSAQEHHRQPKKSMHGKSSMNVIAGGRSPPSIPQGENQRQPESEGEDTGKGINDESSSDSDDSSPEISMSLSENEVKKLKKIFGNFYGTLCYAIKNPVEIAALLQLKGLLSKRVMNDLLTSPASEQTKAITLVTALDKKIKLRPDRIFTIIKVFLQNNVLKEVGRKMWAEAGKWLLYYIFA